MAGTATRSQHAHGASMSHGPPRVVPPRAPPPCRSTPWPTWPPTAGGCAGCPGWRSGGVLGTGRGADTGPSADLRRTGAVRRVGRRGGPRSLPRRRAAERGPQVAERYDVRLRGDRWPRHVARRRRARRARARRRSRADRRGHPRRRARCGVAALPGRRARGVSAELQRAPRAARRGRRRRAAGRPARHVQPVARRRRRCAAFARSPRTTPTSCGGRGRAVVRRGAVRPLRAVRRVRDVGRPRPARRLTPGP